MLTRPSASYTFEEHLSGKSQEIRDLAYAVQDFVMGLDAAIEEAPKKLYVAYRISQNIVCMEVRKKHLALYLKLDPREVSGPPGISRDVSRIGHFGTGDLEIIVKSPADLEASKPFLELAYRRVGG